MSLALNLEGRHPEDHSIISKYFSRTLRRGAGYIRTHVSSQIYWAWLDLQYVSNFGSELLR